MDTDTIHQANIHNLPPEVLSMIFEHVDDVALAQNRTVCAYWRNIIESLFKIQLEMTNQNWEAFVKLSKASYIHLKLTDVQFPIYTAPEFSDFMSRVNILELTGYIPAYNVIKIFKECREIESLTVHLVSIDNDPRLTNFDIEDLENFFDVTQLNVGQPANEDDRLDDILHVTYYVAYLLNFNCLEKLYISTLFNVENVLQLIFAGILDAPPEEFSNNVIEKIWDDQCQSLELISFNFQYGNDNDLSAETEMFIKFHPYEDEPEAPPTANSTNQHRQILESRLIDLQDYERNRQSTQMMLQIFETQLKMKNLVICYRDEGDLARIENIIETNCATLEEITIQSLEPMAQLFRLFSCSCFRSCLTLKELTLCSPIPNRKVKLLDLLLLPTSLEKLSLTRFIPTGSSELFAQVPELSQYPNLTHVELDAFPWFIVDGIPQTIFANFHFHWLMNLFPKIEKLTLTGIPLDTILWWWDSRTFGVPNIPESVSPEFVTWCRQGGGHNARIDSIQISVHEVVNPRQRRFTVHEILIRKDQN